MTGGAAPFSPVDLGWEVTLDPDINLADTATEVDTWQDANSNPAIYVGTTTTRPVLATDVPLNSQSKVVFDGSDDYLEETDTSILNLNGNSLCIIACVRWLTAGRKVLFASRGTSSLGFEIEQDSAGTSLDGRIQGATTNLNATIGSLTTNTFYFVRYEYDSVAETSKIVVDGVAGSTAGPTTIGAVTAANGTRIGGRPGGSRDADVEVFYLMADESIPSAGDQANLLAYFNTRFGTAKAGI